ncbi:MAG: hypothetical protein ABI831_25485, partial [Betaproteobacteria bacterium]
PIAFFPPILLAGPLTGVVSLFGTGINMPPLLMAEEARPPVVATEVLAPVVAIPVYVPPVPPVLPPRRTRH